MFFQCFDCVPYTSRLINFHSIHKTYLLIFYPFIFQEGDSVTNRVAGFVCKYVFCEHESCVTSLVVVEKENSDDSTYLV